MVVEPIPDAKLVDLSTIRLLTLFLIFFLDFTFLFCTVVVSFAPVSFVPRFLICSSLPSALKVNLSAVKTSMRPSERIKVYLSSVNGRYDSPSGNVIVIKLAAAISLLLMSTSKVFLILNNESVRSTEAIFSLGNGV